MNDLFNKKLSEFIDDLVYIYPSVKDFQLFKTTCNWASKLDKNAPQYFFNVCVVEPYEAKVMSRDEDFFLCETYVEYNDYMNQYGHNLDIVEKLKRIWKTLDDGNKDVIWKYLQVLVYLSNQCTKK